MVEEGQALLRELGMRDTGPERMVFTRDLRKAWLARTWRLAKAAKAL